MSDYFQYLQEMFELVFANIGKFLKTAFVTPWADVPKNFSDYSDIFNAYAPNFGGAGWFFYVLFWILLVLAIAAIVYLIYIVIHKYVKFYKTELDKDQLREQVERLNYELYNAVNDKNKILNMKVGQLGVNPSDVEVANTTVVDGIRFPKLVMVDRKYKDYDTHIQMNETSNLNLEQLCIRFRFFAASNLGLYYELSTIRSLFAGMGTTKVLILEGISGTGKTSLPYALGKFFQNDAKICSVQPSWRDRSELLGYYNEFTKKFNESDFLKAVYESTYREDINIVVLDELNLARIEYYFAEFLSIMEMPNIDEWNVELISSPDKATDPKHLREGKLLIPQNIWFVGTANNDDSTFTITDKVYDRAITLFFDNKGIAFDCEFTESVTMSFDYLNKLFEEAHTNYPISAKTLEKFSKLDDFVIAKFKIAFGNRILKQLKLFVPVYISTGGTELEGLDFIFNSKILKKFSSLNLAFLHDELDELVQELNKLFGKNEFTMSKKTIASFLKMNS